MTSPEVWRGEKAFSSCPWGDAVRLWYRSWELLDLGLGGESGELPLWAEEPQSCSTLRVLLGTETGKNNIK